VGCGASVLETAANPFMAQFGPAETSERRLNFAQAFNPPGTIVGVIIGARFIFSGIEKTPTQVAAMKLAGTYAGYLHSELMRVVPTYLVLGSVVLLFAVALSRMKFPAMHSEHEGEAWRSRHLRRAAALSAPVVCRAGELLQRRRADLHLEQPHPVHEAVHPGQRAHRRRLPYRHAGRADAGPLRDDAADEVHLGEQAAGPVRRGERADDGAGDPAAGNAGGLRNRRQRLLPLHHVPDDLRAGPEGSRAEHQARRLAAGDGHRRRRAVSAGAGLDCAVNRTDCPGAMWFR
jgi:hypothetical protein